MLKKFLILSMIGKIYIDKRMFFNKYFRFLKSFLSLLETKILHLKKCIYF